MQTTALSPLAGIVVNTGTAGEGIIVMNHSDGIAVQTSVKAGDGALLPNHVEALVRASHARDAPAPANVDAGASMSGVGRRSLHRSLRASRRDEEATAGWP